jgi:hypothetical protein
VLYIPVRFFLANFKIAHLVAFGDVSSSVSELRNIIDVFVQTMVTREGGLRDLLQASRFKLGFNLH